MSRKNTKNKDTYIDSQSVLDSVHVIDTDKSADENLGNNNIGNNSRYVTVITNSENQQDIDEEGNYVLVEEDAENSDNAYAKSVTISDSNGTKTRFFIKGDLRGYFYNPWGMYSEGREAQRMRRTAGIIWKWIEVSPKVFDFYKGFLKSKNTAKLVNAEREAF